MRVYVSVDLEYLNQHEAQQVCLIPGAERASARTVRFTVDDFDQGMRLFILANIVAKSAQAETL